LWCCSGPRQSGKTTLTRQIASAIKDFPAERNYFDLENPGHLDRLENLRKRCGEIRPSRILRSVHQKEAQRLFLGAYRLCD